MLQIQWTPAFNEWHKFSKAFFTPTKWQQRIAQNTIHQLMLRANTDWKVNRRITMAPYNSWCCVQRRAESPIRIQPRAAPWVKIFQQTCALKEQKEGERTSISLSPVALTARQLVNELTPRVLPWAVFPLGLRPVIARNHGCCTFPHLSLQISTKRLYAAKTGWKPNKNTAQGSALGKDIPTNLRSERAKGRRTNEHFAVSCCTYSAPIS